MRSQINPVHATLSYLSKIDLNIILSPTSRSLSFWLSHQNPICLPLLPMHATCHTHLIPLPLIIVIVLGEKYKL
jgi:hypothetical protein